MRAVTLEYAEQRLRQALDDGDVAAMSTYGDLVDVLDDRARRPLATLLDAALWYATLGLAVFPLSPRSKLPRRHSHGLKDATSDVDVVRAWWENQPDANIGIATGHVVDVLDLDGVQGQRSFARRALMCPDCRAAAEADADAPEHCDQCPTLADYGVLGTVSTPRPGGAHHYIAAKRGRGNRAGVMPHVDIRALGGYVVAPPSITDIGTYTWLRLLRVP